MNTCPTCGGTFAVPPSLVKEIEKLAEYYYPASLVLRYLAGAPDDWQNDGYKIKTFRDLLHLYKMSIRGIEPAMTRVVDDLENQLAAMAAQKE